MIRPASVLALPLMAIVVAVLVANAPAESTTSAKWPTITIDESLAGSPVPQVIVNYFGSLDPLPQGCTPQQVVDVMLAFVDAINRGDETRLAPLFRPDEPDGDGTPDQLQPGPGRFGVGGDFWLDTYSEAEMLAWVADRHGHGERWSVLQIAMSGFWWRGGVDIGFDLRREADDLPPGMMGGKGAVDCDDGTEYQWVTGSREVLHDAWFDPNATVTPGFGFTNPR